jgi:long-chain acyl-CoA synthetase
MEPQTMPSTFAERKVKNAILTRWSAVLAEKADEAAILRPDGSVARRFAGIETEANGTAEILGPLRAGAVVSLQAANIPEWPGLLLGIWKAGGCALLLDGSLSESARDAMERRCGARMRLGGNGAVELEYEKVDFGGAVPDLIKVTSGTTAEPRAILFSAAQIEADCDNICETMGIGGEDINYGIVAFSHSYGFSNLVTPLLCQGVPLVVAKDALPRAVMTGLAASRATVLPAVPAIFEALSSIPMKTERLRLCISAGAPLRVETGTAFRAAFNLKIHTFYGASECGGIAYDANESDVRVQGFVGRPLCGVSIDPEPDGGIFVRSAAVGMDYFPEGDDDLGDGVFKPADFLEQTPDGWRITGRRTDVINVGGKKVSPAEVENVLLSHPAIHEVVVFGVGGGMRTEAICACVVMKDAAEEGEIRAYCARHLAAWQVPKSLIKLDAIPLNARGKVSRRELAERFS